MLNRLIRGVGALIVLVALLVGAPLALIAWVGNPWPPGGWSEVQLLTNRTIIGALAVVGWLDTAKYVEQCRLPRPARTEHHHQLTWVHREVNAA